MKDAAHGQRRTLCGGLARDIPVDATEISVWSTSMLQSSGLLTIDKVADASDEALLSISSIFRIHLAEIREVILECQSGSYIPPQWMVE
jgi:DNA-directed RNA polymerase alpha subunit